MEFIFDDLAHRQNFDRELAAAQKITPNPELGDLCPRKKRFAMVYDRIKNFDNAVTGAYGIIKSHLCEAFIQELQRLDIYKDIEESRDPKKLWETVTDLVINGVSSGVHPMIKLITARSRFEGILQKPNETLDEYAIRFMREY